MDSNPSLTLLPSWVRDIESGRLQVSPKDQSLLRKVLGIIQ